MESTFVHNVTYFNVQALVEGALVLECCVTVPGMESMLELTHMAQPEEEEDDIYGDNVSTSWPLSGLVLP